MKKKLITFLTTFRLHLIAILVLLIGVIAMMVLENRSSQISLMKYVPDDVDQVVVADFTRELGSLIKHSSGLAEYAFLEAYVRNAVVFQRTNGQGEVSNIIIAQLAHGVDASDFFAQLFGSATGEINTIRSLGDGVVAYGLPEDLAYLDSAYTSIEQGVLSGLLSEVKPGYQVGFISKTRPELAGEVNPLAASIIDSVTHTIAFGYVDGGMIQAQVRIASDAILPQGSGYSYQSVLSSYAGQGVMFLELGNMVRLFGLQPLMMQQALKFWLQGFKTPIVYQLTETDIANIVRSLDGNIGLSIIPATDMAPMGLKIIFQNKGISSTLSRLWPVMGVVLTGIGGINFDTLKGLPQLGVVLGEQQVMIPVLATGDDRTDNIVLGDVGGESVFKPLQASDQSYLAFALNGDQIVRMFSTRSITNPTALSDVDFLKGKQLEGSLKSEKNHLVIDMVIR